MKWKVEKIPKPDFLIPLDISCVRIQKGHLTDTLEYLACQNKYS